MEGISSYILAGDLRFHYIKWGERDSLPPIVLLHGLASNARIWEMVAPYLADHGYAVYALDQRGHGLTDKPEEGYDLDTFSGDLRAFLDQLDLEHPVLVGHSFGGTVAVEYASRMQVGPRSPSRLILIDGGMIQMDEDPEATWETISKRLAPPKLAGLPLESFLGMFRNHRPGWQPSDQAVSIFLANFEITDEETIYPHLTFEHHMQLLRAMWDWKGYSLFPRLRCPVLMAPVRPSLPVKPGDARYLEMKERAVHKAETLIPNLTVHWFEDSIHDVPLQKPEEVAATIIGFIKADG